MATPSSTTSPRRSTPGLALTLLGIVLIAGAIIYAAYEKYYLGLPYHLLSFHLGLDGVGGLGVLIFLVGVILTLRRK